MKNEEDDTFDRVLHMLDDEAMRVIDDDERKLKHEAQKISRIQQKINEEEQRYMKMVHEYAEEEVIEGKLEEKQLKKVAEIKAKLEHAFGSELIGEEIKDVCYGLKNNSKAIANDTENRRKELLTKRKAMKSKHDEALKLEKMKIDQFHQQLEDEERAYADIQSDIAIELIYKARIENEFEF